MTTVGVVGASARAAVHALTRAGFSAWAVDQFNDRDLKRIAACALCPSNDYPTAIPELAALFPPGPFIYTGGLENHPDIVSELSQTRELWGNPPEVLTRVRDPIQLTAMLNDAGFATPRAATQPVEGRWLRKPLSSGSGIGIRFAQPGEPDSPRHYIQEFIEGVPMSAIYSGTTFIGVTEQLIGEPWLHALPFAYCGNIGPVATPPGALNTLADSLGLRGVWGLDFILKGDAPYPVELNPRYTAAVEVLEHATGKNLPPRPPLLQGGGSLKSPPPPDARGAGGVGSSRVIGKAVYYAPRAMTFPQSGPWDADLTGTFDPWRLPGFADIPDAGNAVQTGWPVLTFFATGNTPTEVRERLQSRATELDRLFAEHSR